MTSHGDAVAKMSAFASRADSFVNAALDQLDDAVEQAFVGESSDEVAKIQAAAMTPAQSALLRTTSQFWSTLALDAKREDWRDAATVVASAQASVDDSKRTLAEAAREAQSKKTRVLSHSPFLSLSLSLMQKENACLTDLQIPIFDLDCS